MLLCQAHSQRGKGQSPETQRRKYALGCLDGVTLRCSVADHTLNLVRGNKGSTGQLRGMQFVTDVRVIHVPKWTRRKESVVNNLGGIGVIRGGRRDASHAVR